METGLDHQRDTPHSSRWKIHSDMERGFIRAEVITYDDLIAHGGNLASAREKGWYE